MSRPVFLPTEFRLLRRPCKRYNTAPMPEPFHSQASPLVSGVRTSYMSGARGANIGSGCWRTLPSLRG